MSRKPDRPILIFMILAFAPMLVLSVIYYRVRVYKLLLIMMLLPALASVLTRIITKEGFKEMMILPRFKGNLKWYLAAYFATPFIAYFGAAVFFMIFPKSFSPLQSSFASEASVTSASELVHKLLLLIPIAIVVNPLMGIVQCFGEELGWRGYLLPKLARSYSPLPAAILTGAIWGLWHAPIIAIGYNYGSEHPVWGIIAMVIYSTVLGIIAGFLTYKTKSVWPAVLFHASLNGMDLWRPSFLFMSEKPNMFLGPDALGVIGGTGFVFIDLILIAIMRKWKSHSN